MPNKHSPCPSLFVASISVRKMQGLGCLNYFLMFVIFLYAPRHWILTSALSVLPTCVCVSLTWLSPYLNRLCPESLLGREVAGYQIVYQCQYLMKPDVELSMRATLRAPVKTSMEIMQSFKTFVFVLASDRRIQTVETFLTVYVRTEDFYNYTCDTV